MSSRPRAVSSSLSAHDDNTTIGVGMLGYGFIGRAHADGYARIARLPGPVPHLPELITIAGRGDGVVSAARRFGFEEHQREWSAVVSDPRVRLFDNCGPNDMHADPTIAAAENGCHVVCEKPLGRTGGEAHAIWKRVAACEVTHMCAFNYRFVPGVRFIKDLVASGELGEITQFRARYLQDWLCQDQLEETWRLDRQRAGSGVVADLGAHLSDLARYLVGEVTAVMARTRTFRPAADVDDAFLALLDFENGAVGAIEASRVALGRKNALTLEISGTRGSASFDLERLNEVKLCQRADSNTGGFTQVLVTEPTHPFGDLWWPPGHGLGWEHSIVHELLHLLNAIENGEGVSPHGANFEDGYRAAEICDAILVSGQEGRLSQIEYRP